VLIVDTVNKQTNITNITEIFFKNLNWWEADQLAIYKAWRSWIRDHRRPIHLVGAGFEPGTSGSIALTTRPRCLKTSWLSSFEEASRSKWPHSLDPTSLRSLGFLLSPAFGLPAKSFGHWVDHLQLGYRTRFALDRWPCRVWFLNPTIEDSRNQLPPFEPTNT